MNKEIVLLYNFVIRAITASAYAFARLLLSVRKFPENFLWENY